MPVPYASGNLHAYKAWRRSLVPLPAMTVLEWILPYTGLAQRDNIKAGQRFVVMGNRKPIIGVNECDADLVYILQLVSKSGKLFKRKEYYDVEGIARRIDEGMVRVAS